MELISKVFCLLLIVALAIPMFIVVEPVFAQSISSSSATEFTLKLTDHSYDIPAKTTSSTDPYTGKVTTTTIPGYHVKNITIDAIINNNLGASYYNFAYKGHYEKDWNFFPFHPNASNGYTLADSYSVPFQASSSSYTTVALTFLPKVPENGTIDIQVQALFGNFKAVPYGHLAPLPAPTYDFYFNGTVSDWSNTQTFTMPATSASPSPSPTIPELSWLVIAPLLLSVFSIAIIVGHRRVSKQQTVRSRRQVG